MDVNGKDICTGDKIKITSSKINSLLREGEEYQVYLKDGMPLIQVGISLSEVSPNHCEIVDN